MSIPAPAPSSAPAPQPTPKPASTKSRRFFLPVFITTLVADLLLALLVFAIGIGSGCEGQLAFTPHFASALEYLFGGTQNTALFVGVVIVATLLLRGVYRLSKAGRHKMVAVIAVIALVLGMVIASQVSSWKVVIPVILLLAVVAIQTRVITTITGRR